MTPAFAPLAPSAPANRIRAFWSRTIPSSCAASSRDGCRRAASRSSATRAERAARRSRRSTGSTPDIVLLDLDMPELDGISALPRLLEKRPGLARDRGLDADPAQCRDLAEMPVASARSTTCRSPRRTARSRPRSASGRSSSRRSRRSPARAAPRPASETEPRRRRRRGAAPARYRSRRAASSSAPRPAVRGDRRGPRRPRRRAAAGADRSSCSTCRRSSRRSSPSISRRQLGVPAREAGDGEALVAGQIYVAPGGRHIGLVRDQRHKRRDPRSTTGRRSISAGRPSTSCSATPPRSSEPRRSRVVLTGMGSDGLARRESARRRPAPPSSRRTRRRARSGACPAMSPRGGPRRARSCRSRASRPRSGSGSGGGR